MSFQSTVSLAQGLGVAGEYYADDPKRAQSYILRTTDHPEYNIFGRAFTVVSEGVVTAGGTGVFAGILADPKQHALQGTTLGGSLAPSLQLPNETQADICSMGTMIVTLPAAAAIGDLVVYNTTTGALSTVAPGAALPVGTLFAQAAVSYFTVSAAGLAVITLSPLLVAPIPA